MLTLKTSWHIRTMRHIRSFRSCPTATGESMAHLDGARVAREEEGLAKRQERRRRLGAEGANVRWLLAKQERDDP